MNREENANSSSAELVTVIRGPVVESVHMGHVAVVDHTGHVLYRAGNPDTVTYMRSAAKPIQVLPVILSGAADTYAFTDTELAVMCASHYAEPHHLEAVRSILNRIGLTEDHLLCGPAQSLNPDVARRQAWDHQEKKPIFNDCSGKHAGMLSVCVHMGWPLDTYTDPDHPLQQDIRQRMADVCGLDPLEIQTGVDGCSVPVFAMPLSAMARSFSKLANPELVDNPVRGALHRIRYAMWGSPEMLAGTGGFCSALNRGGCGTVIGKLGAEGLYCIGVAGKDMGIALKIQDGSFRAVWPSAVRLLDQLGITGESLKQEISVFRDMPNRNAHGETVGRIHGVFRLKQGTEP